MSENDDAAKTLYPQGKQDANSTPTERSVHPDAEVAAKIYAVKPQTLSAPARVAYTNREDDLRVVAAKTRHDAEQIAAEVFGGAAEAGIGAFDHQELPRRLFNAVVDREVAIARGAAIEPDEGVEQARREQTRIAVMAAFGSDDVDELLARTNKFVKSHPRLLAALNRSGLGNDRDTVVSLVEHVRAVNFR